MILVIMASLILRSMSQSLSAVFITVGNQESATRLAKGMVESQLAACVNIIPGVISVYKWEGQMNEDQEVVLMVKTRSELVDELTQWVKENHSYSCPEVIALPVVGGNLAYFDFVLGGTKCPGK
jgi:periplasmic divalent cation tolerance protein